MMRCLMASYAESRREAAVEVARAGSRPVLALVTLGLTARFGIIRHSRKVVREIRLAQKQRILGTTIVCVLEGEGEAESLPGRPSWISLKRQ